MSEVQKALILAAKTDLNDFMHDFTYIKHNSVIFVLIVCSLTCMHFVGFDVLLFFILLCVATMGCMCVILLIIHAEHVVHSAWILF